MQKRANRTNSASPQPVLALYFLLAFVRPVAPT